MRSELGTQHRLLLRRAPDRARSEFRRLLARSDEKRPDYQPAVHGSFYGILRPMSSRPTVCVIGAGLGGLAVAIRLQARGYQVTILEHRDAPGGRAYVYRDNGFIFDAGPTVVTAPWLITELWDLAGKRADDYLKIVPIDPYYRIHCYDGRVFNYSGDAARMEAEVEKFSPSDLDGYRRFLVESEKIFKKGFEELGDVPFSRFTDMLKIAPALVRLGSHRSVHAMVAKYIRDDSLRQVLSFHPLLVGGNPFAASSIYALIHFLERRWGVHYAMGGTGAIVAAMVKLFGELGGELRLSSTVEEILVENGRARGVRLAGGATVKSDLVVSNGDAGHTYRHLIDPRHRRKWNDRRLDRARFSMSLFVIYFGLKSPRPDLAHHTILLGPRYRELLDDIFTRKVLAEDFSLYLHRPTATDPQMAPPGCETFYVLSPVPHLQSGTDWGQVGEAYRDKILGFLEQKMLPGLQNDLATVRHITPANFRDDLLSLHGAAFSLEPVLTQSAWFRPHNLSEDVENLFLVGAGTHPGAGMPGVLSTARVVDRLIPRLPGDGDRDPIAGSHA
jgi:phytoene desaturase